MEAKHIEEIITLNRIFIEVEMTYYVRNAVIVLLLFKI